MRSTMLDMRSLADTATSKNASIKSTLTMHRSSATGETDQDTGNRGFLGLLDKFNEIRALNWEACVFKLSLEGTAERKLAAAMAAAASLTCRAGG